MAVRFCSECGEQIKVRRVRLLPFGLLCRKCAPGHRRARVALVASFVLIAAIIFAIARLTAPREPFYLIGTPLELNSRRDPATNQNRNVSSDENNLAQREQATASSTAIEFTCGAQTKSGRPCRRKVKGGGHCWQHRDKFRPTDQNKPR